MSKFRFIKEYFQTIFWQISQEWSKCNELLSIFIHVQNDVERRIFGNLQGRSNSYLMLEDIWSIRMPSVKNHQIFSKKPSFKGLSYYPLTFTLSQYKWHFQNKLHGKNGSDKKAISLWWANFLFISVHTIYVTFR